MQGFDLGITTLDVIVMLAVVFGPFFYAMTVTCVTAAVLAKRGRAGDVLTRGIFFMVGAYVLGTIAIWIALQVPWPYSYSGFLYSCVIYLCLIAVGTADVLLAARRWWYEPKDDNQNRSRPRGGIN